MDFIDDFIEEYKNNPCLWKASSIHFKNRIKRQEAYAKLINIAAKHGEHYNVERTKQKINNLRCAFRHQLKKYIELKNKREKDEPYCPKRRYFESLMFLRDEENSDVKRKLRETHSKQCLEVAKNSSESEMTSDHNDSTGRSINMAKKNHTLLGTDKAKINCVETISQEPKENLKFVAERNAITPTVDYGDEKVTGTHEFPEGNRIDRKDETESISYDFETNLPILQNRGQDPCRKRSSSLCSQPSRNIDLVPSKAMKVDFSPTDFGKLFSLACKGIDNNSEDHFTSFGKIIAHKLRSMDATQAMFAEKIIADVLFQGQMKLLSPLNINQFLSINCSESSDIYTGK